MDKFLYDNGLRHERVKMDTQWFKPWVNLNGLSVIYLLCLNTKNQRWQFTFGQTPIFAADWENKS